MIFSRMSRGRPSSMVLYVVYAKFVYIKMPLSTTTRDHGCHSDLSRTNPSATTYLSYSNHHASPVRAILKTISNANVETLSTLSAAIEDRRFSLGISKFSKASIYLVRAFSIRTVSYLEFITRSLNSITFPNVPESQD